MAGHPAARPPKRAGSKDRRIVWSAFDRDLGLVLTTVSLRANEECALDQKLFTFKGESSGLLTGAVLEADSGSNQAPAEQSFYRVNFPHHFESRTKRGPHRKGIQKRPGSSRSRDLHSR